MLPVSVDCFCCVFLRLVYPINNLQKLATYDTQDEEKQNKNNPEKLTT
jgi:hypothetical protein